MPILIKSQNYSEPKPAKGKVVEAEVVDEACRGAGGEAWVGLGEGPHELIAREHARAVGIEMVKPRLRRLRQDLPCLLPRHARSALHDALLLQLSQ